jgi:hypothetical protein
MTSRELPTIMPGEDTEVYCTKQASFVGFQATEENERFKCFNHFCIFCSFVKKILLLHFNLINNENKLKKNEEKTLRNLYINGKYELLDSIKVSFSYNQFESEGPARIRTKLIPKRDYIKNEELTKKFYENQYSSNNSSNTLSEELSVK